MCLINALLGQVKCYFTSPVTRLYVQVTAGLAAKPTRLRYFPSTRPYAQKVAYQLTANQW
jgi:hypothetical protein